MAGECLEQQGQYCSDLGKDGFKVGLSSKVPSLNEILQKLRILLVPAFSFLRVEVFAKYGAPAGKVVLVGRVQDGVEEAFEEAQACTN